MPRLLAVHAHPDDETLTMGATLARCAAEGIAVTLVTATLGEQGEVIGAELAGLAADEADQLGGYRYTELAAACRALGITDHRMLGGVGAFRDSGMAGTPSADHPRAFVRARTGGPDHARAVAALVAVIDEVRPDVLLTYDADGGYGHPDHIAAHEVAVAAAAGRVPRVLAAVKPRAELARLVAGMTVPAGYAAPRDGDLGFLVDDAEIGATVELGPGAPARRAALAAHATQVELLPGGFALSNRIAQPDPSAEWFRVVTGDALPGIVSGGPDVLFAGAG
ncbi:N-acetyl-1-D-myo-inositol-2-amino-2-deoxy-alpha-D-glucopyranoside deacetylase [Nakamurella flavida]|uniref:1D-myo-inositol 2-acetamido-2-deoxy-alpha-D-glucopyranoside deacetylase n=1 Tax=Nakamurella flavida TaxID=363630 RepID=A0A938YKP9_9ACTN|nr:N-acetyl-1-D-myo-inositol-2-amino-2-deoxy-alpha-D-glucopyranoside deacetylase [Nakamurella flavida]MBM9476949.1 N-acetyl-1-D-myo-inositol-2-amino-2-deoxy-alpha-D-glucopyranoside deacetylase [Nakamurella flavida]MDP9779894.1 N-acetyl-1-D-myo-inositol-2-amino-2-deoxy-alpha-D-glucopyranoside deacetylase [Nakamurella flavida]